MMRCIAVAEELVANGQETIFVGRISEIPWVEAKVKSLGISDYFDEPSDFHSDPSSDVLILDSYEIDLQDPFIDSKKWRKVVALVDDTTPKYRADLYIHSGPGTPWFPPEMDKPARFLSCPEYVAIRRSIRNLKRNVSVGVPNSLRILVIGGGSDPFGFCDEVVKAIHSVAGNFFVTVLSGRSIRISNDERFKYVEMGSTLEDLLVDTDLVFTAAGTSSWEFLSCAFPIGLACAADNQLANYQYQTQTGLAAGIGSLDGNGKWNFDQAVIEKLVTQPQIRLELSERAKRAVDGNGSTRICKELIALASC